MKKVKKYMNLAQLFCTLVAAKNLVLVAGRAFGKSEGIDAFSLLRDVLSMPRALGVMLNPTYSKGLQNTLPAVATALARFGYHRDKHYVLGRPPKKWKWPRPIVEPFDYDHCMYWFNGTVVSLVSFDRSMSVNSQSIDFIKGFEAKFLNPVKIKEEVVPANRGKREYFGNCAWHHGWTFTTDMPALRSGAWLFDYEKNCDEALINLILDTVGEKQQLSNDFERGTITEDYYRRKLRRIEKDLFLFRKNATLYREFDTLENLEVLGEDFIKEQIRDLPKLTLLTSIFNQRPKKVTNGFYSALDENLHYYESSNISYLDSLGYDLVRAAQKDCRGDGDVLEGRPLYIALDYNAAINNISTGQLDGARLRTISHRFVKTPKKVQDLMNEWCDYYEAHDSRDVVYFWDSTAAWETAASGDTYSDVVLRILRDRGWNVFDVYIGKPELHDAKHLWIDSALKGNPQYLFPQFNKINCETLLGSMEQAHAIIMGNRTKKSKSEEKKPDSVLNPSELRTHASDAWDTLFIGMCFHRPLIDSGPSLATKFGM